MNYKKERGKHMKAKLTENGIKVFNDFLKRRQERQEKILKSGVDTLTEPIDITQEDIECDIITFGDKDGYYNRWFVTDDPRYDMPLFLEKDKDYLIYEEY